MDDQIVIYLSQGDKQKIEMFAQEQRLPVSTFCRFLILKTIKNEEAQAE